ncbi:hypothetical protein P279_28635 [Rhodobacteraceae bacterium PD-2]|nr:hypothetical protein P279_28635 [Rhodobacteraceae bacterium PD-2]
MLLEASPLDCWRARPESDGTAALRTFLTMAGHDPEGHPALVTGAAAFGFLRDRSIPSHRPRTRFRTAGSGPFGQATPLCAAIESVGSRPPLQT